MLAHMSDNRYRLVGFVVWRGAKWYLRRRLPSRRKVILAGLATTAALTAGAVAARRLSG